MKYIIGLFGSSEENESVSFSLARELGKELAKEEVILVTGACPGTPYQAVKEAKRQKNELEIIGYSSELDLKGQKKYAAKDDHTVYTSFVFVPKSFPFSHNVKARMKYRNVISTATCDAGIIISGRYGTLNEFTNLYDMGKIIGVLTSSGGITEMLPEIMRKIKKESKSKIIFNKNPQELVKLIMKELTSRAYDISTKTQ